MPQAAFRIEPIIPKDSDFVQTQGSRVLSEISKFLKTFAGPHLSDAFEDRTTGWNHSPDIEQKFSETVDQMVIAVTPQGKNRKIWIYVSGGAKSHMIFNRKRTSRGTGGLYVKGGIGGYSPKTRPGNIFGGSGSYNMSATFRAYSVHHPGIAPREFEKHIIEDEAGDIVDELARTIDRLVSP